MKLLIVRHAIAEDREVYRQRADGSNDDFRPLTDEGVRKMRKNASGLRELVGRPRLLVSSPLTRAIQTAEILAEAWKGLHYEISEALRPEAKFEDLVRWLAENAPAGPDARSTVVAVVGHEPHLSGLIHWLVSGTKKSSRIDLKKGGACLIEFDGKPGVGQGRMAWLLPPSVLRACRD